MLLVVLLVTQRSPISTLYPYTTLFRSSGGSHTISAPLAIGRNTRIDVSGSGTLDVTSQMTAADGVVLTKDGGGTLSRSEEHTSELQSLTHLVCRLLLEKNKPSN